MPRRKSRHRSFINVAPSRYTRLFYLAQRPGKRHGTKHMKKIRIKGARTHNLKNIDVEFPRNKLVVITGLSGSGKSSLAFDTIFAEGQRRYIESLSAYARQFLSRVEKPDVDQIDGLSPAISIEQKSTSHNPRSTVGTITEIYDYLRLLFARVGTPRCPLHGESLEARPVSQIVDEILTLPTGLRLMILAPIVRNRKGEYVQLLKNLAAQGFVRARINGGLFELDAPPKLDLRKKHTIEAVIDRIKLRADNKTRLADSLETALNLSDGVVTIAPLEESDPGLDKDLTFSTSFACPHCGYSLSELEPRLFSFNNPVGACSECDGLGVVRHFDESKIVCNPALSLSVGAIHGWDRNSRYNFRRIKSLATRHRFDINAPFSSLPAKTRRLILYGGDGSMEFSYRSRGRRRIARSGFDGIIPIMERRYHEADSNVVREKLSRYITISSCTDCGGTRLNKTARNVFVSDLSLPEISAMTIEQALKFSEQVKLPRRKAKIAEKIMLEIRKRLKFLADVGLNYLSMDRSAETLSGGEAQRIRLASQIGSGLVGVMYILDEPSIGLHQRDNQRLLDTLTRLRDLGNSVIVVEHDEEAIRTSDHIIDMGPGAGKHGGRVVAQGTPIQIEKSRQSITGQYLAGKRSIAIPAQRTSPRRNKRLCLSKLSGNNLKNIDAEIPLGLFVAVTGVSGSGKSTLIKETLYKHAARKLYKNGELPAPCKSIKGIEHIDKIIDINQSPIGRTPRSNPATYTGLFTPIRELFSRVPEARARGYLPGRFSFNVKGGRCEVCRGDGVTKVEMHFLPDIYVRCDNCFGKRYNRETLDILYKGKNINEVLDMTVEQALDFFHAIPVIKNKLQTLVDVGLDYISLGQNATTLSGGEAQRVKLSRELSRRSTGKTLYLLDEPTTGLHFHDVEQLLKVLHRLRGDGNTVIVIEHNLDVIKTADWIIDLGPEGGDKGGEIITTGTPEDVAACRHSYTGRHLRAVLK